MTTPSSHHTIWLRPHAAAFVYLPKVACTSWKLHLAAALGIQSSEPLSYKNLHNPEVLPLPYVARLSAEEQEALAAQQQSSSFHYYTVMRDPRERAVSAYRDKILLHANPQSFFSLQVLPSIQVHAGLSSDEKPSFEQFLQWMETSDDPATQNDHWLPTTRLLGLAPGEGIPSQWRFWTMDAMSDAVAFMNQLLGFERAFPEREALGLRPDRRSKASMPDLISAEAEQLLQILYKDDLALYVAIEREQK